MPSANFKVSTKDAMTFFKRVIGKETQITIKPTFVDVKFQYYFLLMKLSVCRCCEISVQYNTRKVIDRMVRLIVMYRHRQIFVVVTNALFVIVHS